LVGVSLGDIDAGGPLLRKTGIPKSKLKTAHEKKKIAKDCLYEDSYWQQENYTVRSPPLTGLIFE